MECRSVSFEGRLLQLKRVVNDTSLQRYHMTYDLKDLKEQAMQISGKSGIWSEKTACSTTLSQEECLAGLRNCDYTAVARTE